MGRLGFFIAVFLGVASMAVGCGDGSDDATAAAPTKAQFVKKASAFCAKTEQEKFDLIGVAFRAQTATDPRWEPDQADLEETTLKVVLPVIKKVPERMAEMTPPAGDEEKLDAIVAAFESDIEKTEAEPKRFLDGIAFEEGSKAAKAYGLPFCTF